MIVTLIGLCLLILNIEEKGIQKIIEALKNLVVPRNIRVRLDVYNDNPAAIKAYEK
jgi:hypothetical protein